MASKRQTSKPRPHHASEKKSKQHATASKRSDNGEKPSKSRKKPTSGLSRFKWFLVILTLLIVLFVYFLDIAEVKTNAMMPSLAKGDVVLVFAPAFVSLSFESGGIGYMERSSKDLAPNFLRVVGGPGQIIRYDDDQLVIDGISPKRLRLTNEAIIRPADEPEIWRETLSNGRSYRILLPKQGLHGSIHGEFNLEPETFFVVGDNRMASYDSRQMGAVPQKSLTGKPLFILYSSHNDGILGHYLKGI